jgi:Cu-Zn family superoxide dismutase
MQLAQAPARLAPNLAFLSAIVAGSMASVAADPAFASPAPPGPTATAAIQGGDGGELGKLTLTEGPAGILLRMEFRAKALTPGWHGVHFHAVGDCSDAGFQRSGPHVGHGEGKAHGLLNPKGAEWGDLPNIFAPTDGPFAVEMFTTFVTLAGAPGRAPLNGHTGSALVIHANADDHVTQPIGGAGARVACAVIARPRG